MVISLILPRILSLSPVPHQTPRELAFCEVECAKDALVCQGKTQLAMLWLIIQRQYVPRLVRIAHRDTRTAGT